MQSTVTTGRLYRESTSFNATEVPVMSQSYAWFVTGVRLVGWTEETIACGAVEFEFCILGNAMGPELSIEPRQIIEHHKRRRDPYPLSVFVPSGAEFKLFTHSSEAELEVEIFWERA